MNDLNYQVNTDTKISYSVGSVENYNFINDTLKDRIDLMASLYPDHVPYIFEQNGGLHMTYMNLKNLVESNARNLLRLGFKKGDRLAMQLPDTVELVLLMFACAYIGVIAVPIDSTRFSHELVHMLEKTNPRGIVLMTSFDGINYLDNFKQLCPELKNYEKGELVSEKFTELKHVICLKKFVGLQLENDPKYDFRGIWDYDEVFNSQDYSTLEDVQFPDVNSHDIFILLFTSGTTGPKKGAISTFYKFLNSCNLYLNCLDKSNDWLKRSCNCLSFSFTAIILTGFLPVLLRFPVQIIFPSFRRNLLNTMRTMEKYKCNSLFAPPKFVFDLIHHEKFVNYDLSALKYVQTIGQILTFNVVKESFKKFNLKFFVNNYGMAEILRTTYLLIQRESLNENEEEKEGMFPIGKALPYVELKVTDPTTGKVVPFGNTGELCVRSFSTLNCYWDDVQNTKECLSSEGWFRTGDIVFMDEKGFVHYKNRFKEVIRFQDADVFPSDIECFLRAHESIADANVFSIAINGYDEYLCAWIILNEGEENRTSLEEINRLLRERVHMSRKLFIKFVKDFPTGAAGTGKVVKRELARLYKEELNL